jgi:hypothetical protein
MRPVFMIYAGIGVLVIFNYFFNLYRLKEKKKQIETIYSEWSTKFNLKIPLNWLIWLLVVAYFSWSLFLIITGPHRDNDYTPLVIFFLFSSFYPRWNVVIGSEGIITGMEVFLWEDLREWQIIHKGKYKYLELKWYSPRLLETKTRRIRLPKNNKLILDLNG